jgi:hypothetical protein
VTARVSLTRAEGVARMRGACALVRGDIVDGDGDGDLEVDDVIVKAEPAEREFRRIAVYYGLGRGGDDAAAPVPWDRMCRVDCSAAVAWALGYARNVGDWNTSKILSDAFEMRFADPNDGPMPRINVGPGPRTRFRPVDFDEVVLPGDVLVIDGVFEMRDGKRVRVRPGHVEMIVDVEPDFVRGGSRWYRDLVVAGSSPSKSKRFGPGHALAETDASFGRTRGYILRYLGWQS